VAGEYESLHSDMGVEGFASSDHKVLVVCKTARNSDHDSKVADPLKALEPAGCVRKRPNFKPMGPEKDTRAINTSIYNCTNSEIKSPKDPKEVKKPGWIYIFESPEIGTGCVEIVKTDRNPDGRKKNRRNADLNCWRYETAVQIPSINIQPLSRSLWLSCIIEGGNLDASIMQSFIMNGIWRTDNER
jgi:hypothetical protein